MRNVQGFLVGEGRRLPGSAATGTGELAPHCYVGSWPLVGSLSDRSQAMASSVGLMW